MEHTLHARGMIRTLLETPALPCVVPTGVFDAFGWCPSDALEWRRPSARFDSSTPLDGSNPARMVFVFHADCAFLPRELARLHAFGLGLSEEQALAPYGIDDATDGLFERGVRPRDLLWLAADNLNALMWGLHDWVHFHNHGPLEQRAWTELQCDGTALAWIWLNRGAIGLDDATFARWRGEVEALVASRFADEGLAFDPAPLARLVTATGAPAS
jgi:hypothetical protein